MTVSFALVATVLAIGLVTFLIRLSFIGLIGGRRVPEWLVRTLRFVPPAVLGALIWPELVLSNGAIAIDLGNHRLLAGLVAIGAAVLSRNVFLTLAVGLGTLWVLTAL